MSESIDVDITSVDVVDVYERRSGHLYFVTSSDKDKEPYTVFEVNEDFICVCKQFIYRDVDCKHIKAAKDYKN